MNIQKSDLASQFGKQRTAIFIISILLALLFFVLRYLLPASPSKVASVAANRGQTALFRLYSDTTDRYPHNPAAGIPAIFYGIVNDTWKADNVPNRHICLSHWLFDRAHESLCAGLSAYRILAIRVEGDGPPMTAFVPVPLVERVAVGDRVRVIRGAHRRKP